MIELNIGNYRGALQIDEQDSKYYWRVDCDVSDERWQEIPKYLYNAITKFNGKANDILCEEKRQRRRNDRNHSKDASIKDADIRGGSF